VCVDYFSQLETEVKIGLMERNISLINPVQFEADENLDERVDLFANDVRVFFLNMNPKSVLTIMCKVCKLLWVGVCSRVCCSSVMQLCSSLKEIYGGSGK